MSKQKDTGLRNRKKNPIHQAVQIETSPPHLRRYRAILFITALAVMIGCFTVLAFWVKRTAFFPVDLIITRWLQSFNQPFFTSAMNWVSWVGYSPQCDVFIALVAVLLYVLGLHWEAVSAVVAAIFEALLNLLIKLLIHRPRPSADLVHVFRQLGSYSFPSGHVMFYTCFFGYLFFLSFSLLKPSWKRALLLTAMGLQIPLIGISRIYLGEHWASDAVGAYLLGGIALLAVIQFYRWGKPRFFLIQPVARNNR